jgi:hypothetical protein
MFVLQIDVSLPSNDVRFCNYFGLWLHCNTDPENAIASCWMHICDNARIDAGHRLGAAARTAALLTAGFALLAGCASPGPPLPPSLKLPEIVAASSLTATRVGDQVSLHWTTPTQTTDKLLIAGPITAEICRETVSTSTVAAQNPRRNAITPPCSPVMKLPVASGPSDATDPLPPALLAEPPSLLAYRVQLLNSAGRTAGPSSAVFAASGPAPQAVQNWTGRPSKIGAVLEWKAETGSNQAIELDRIVPGTQPAAKPASTVADTVIKSDLLGAGKEKPESRFRAGGDTDAGGTIDRSALIGHTYRYTAQRVRTVVVGGQTLQVRSVRSAEVTVAMPNEFPPDAPVGLVAVPGIAGETDDARKPAIDLSWEPNAEPRIAGYRVYRQNRDAEGDAANPWQRLDADPVPLAAYRDATVVAGRKYAYRVTAVNEAGIESPRSDEVVETAPAQ